MRQILYLIQKEFRQVFRDRAMIFIIFFAPLVQMVVLGFAITVDIKNIETVIVDQDNSTVSREISRKFEYNEYFSVTGYHRDLNAVREQIDKWQTQLAIVIPHDFARDLARQATPQIQIIVDGVDGNTAGIAMGYASEILQEYVLRLAMAGEPGLASPNRISLIEPLSRMWFNLDLESKNYMVPGLIAVLLTLISMFLTSMALVREKEAGTLEQLMVTPITTWQLILGKVLPFLILAFVELGLMLVVAFVVFGLTVAGSLTLLFALATLYLLSTLGFGIFISTLAHSQQQAMFISWFFMVFLIFMSGFLFPIENMPDLVQKLTYLDPMRYFVIILREIFLKGTSARFLIDEILMLSGMGLVVIALSAVKFQKRVT